MGVCVVLSAVGGFAVEVVEKLPAVPALLSAKTFSTDLKNWEVLRNSDRPTEKVSSLPWKEGGDVVVGLGVVVVGLLVVGLVGLGPAGVGFVVGWSLWTCSRFNLGFKSGEGVGGWGGISRGEVRDLQLSSQQGLTIRLMSSQQGDATGMVKRTKIC